MAPRTRIAWGLSSGGASRRPVGSIRATELSTPAATLFLRLGREQQRIALGAAGVGGARRLGLGDVFGEDRDHAYTALMRGDHDFVGLVLGHAKFRLQDGDDEIA